MSSEERRRTLRPPAGIEVELKPAVLAGAVVFALIAGWTDWRSRRIPNWLTVPALALGVVLNTVFGGWNGLKTSLLGVLVGLGLLLPLVMLGSLGAGDWKFAGALGAFAGPRTLLDLLIASVFVAGAMAMALIIYKRRVIESLRNMGHILVSLVTFRLPGAHVTLDNPNALKIPKGVALSLAVLLYAVAHLRGVA
jgi:prepilin peptidase CpaA